MHLHTVFILLVSGCCLFVGTGFADTPQASDQDTAIHVPTPPDIVAKMLEVAELTARDVLYDLGCGDGRIVIAAAEKTGCRAVGYDIDQRKVLESRNRVKQAEVEHLVRIYRQDIFQLDLSKASVVTLYLLPEMNEQLIPQLKKMKSGSRIVTHDFPIAGLRHADRLTVTSTHDGAPHQIFLYKLPLQPDSSVE